MFTVLPSFAGITKSLLGTTNRYVLRIKSAIVFLVFTGSDVSMNHAPCLHNFVKKTLVKYY